MNTLTQKIQSQAFRLVLWQNGAVLILAVCTGLLLGFKSGFSIFCGGLAYGIPNLIFVWRVFRYSSAQDMNKFMVAFYFGEALKLIFSAILFVLVVKTLPVSLLSVLVGFITAIVSFWIVCLWQFSKQPRAGQNNN